MKFLPLFTLLLFLHFPGVLFGAEKEIHVFVALCDNASQGIVKVGDRIGDGDKPNDNLYWGCSDGLKLYFKRSKNWEALPVEASPDETILDILRFERTGFPDTELVAYAYRGSEIKACMEAFLKAVADPHHPADLVAFIGHNGLMDFRLPLPEQESADSGKDVAVLCCLSQRYFESRLEAMGARPILLTDQLMYPGSFILHDVIEGWLREESLEDLRLRAAKAYAANQKISVRAAQGVFSDLED